MEDTREAQEQVSLMCRGKAVVMGVHTDSRKRRPECMTQGRPGHQSPSYGNNAFTQHVKVTGQVKVCFSVIY